MLATKFDQKEEFNRLGSRRHSFRKMVRHLDKQTEDFIIVETGTCRAPDAWEGDGQSTLIWDWVCKNNPLARAYSVDLSPEACKLSQSQVQKVGVVQSDSVGFLTRLPEEVKNKIKLLYLDSFDWSERLNFDSAFHHLAELTAVYSSLPKGCMIVVDDCHAPNYGKHWLVENFFMKLGLMPVFNGYQTGWIKP